MGRLKKLGMVRGDVRPEEYFQHVRGWSEYMTDEEYRSREQEAVKAKVKKTSPRRVLDIPQPVDDLAELKEEMRQIKEAVLHLTEVLKEGFADQRMRLTAIHNGDY